MNYQQSIRIHNLKKYLEIEKTHRLEEAQLGFHREERDKWTSKTRDGWPTDISECLTSKPETCPSDFHAGTFKS